MRKTLFLAILVSILIWSCGPGKTKKDEMQRLNYPQTKKGSVTDNYFGTQVADPYRWLEDDNSAETKAWVDAQNKVTFGYLEKIPFRDTMKKRLEEIWNYPRMSTPNKKGEHYFYSKNNGLQNQNVIFMRKDITGEEIEILDPNKLSEDGTVALIPNRYQDTEKNIIFAKKILCKYYKRYLI